MLKYKQMLKKYHCEIMLIFVFILGAFARIYMFGKVPGGVNQDEALSGYEAYSLLKTGKDIHGYRNPVYFMSWGSGMNVLNSYLLIPFVALFGLEVWVIRFPQLVVGLLTISVAYLLGKEIKNKQIGIFFAFLISIAPWHILMCRWGLEANLAPGFLLFGVYFFVKGSKKPKFFVISGLMFGLSLYTYATIWYIVPFLFLFMALYYLFYHKKNVHWKELGIGGGILGISSVPLLLFLCINKGYMKEVKLSFISIPKLLKMRAPLFSVENLKNNLRTFWNILYIQTDGMMSNGTKETTTIYHITSVLVLIGSIVIIRKFIKGFKEKKYYSETNLFIWFFLCLVQGSLFEANINKINAIYLPMLMIAGMAIYELWEKTNKKKYFLILVTGIYLLLFINFENYYFTEYREKINWQFGEGLEKAVERAEQFEGYTCVSSKDVWTKVLFFSEEDPEIFRNTVEYYNYPDEYLMAKSFGNWEFYDDELDIKAEKKVFVLKKGEYVRELEGMKMKSEYYGNYVVWYQ